MSHCPVQAKAKRMAAMRRDMAAQKLLEEENMIDPEAAFTKIRNQARPW